MKIFVAIILGHLNDPDDDLLELLRPGIEESVG
jgi:hypothetical protein